MHYVTERDDKFYIVVDSGSKGGRYREAEIVGTPEQISRVVERVRSAPADKKVFSHDPTAMDVH